MYAYPIFLHFFHVTTSQPAQDQERILAYILGKLMLDTGTLYQQSSNRFFVAAYSQRIINIHHSFPRRVHSAPIHYQQAFERGVKLIAQRPTISR